MCERDGDSGEGKSTRRFELKVKLTIMSSDSPRGTLVPQTNEDGPDLEIVEGSSAEVVERTTRSKSRAAKAPKLEQPKPRRGRRVRIVADPDADDEIANALNEQIVDERRPVAPPPPAVEDPMEAELRRLAAEPQRLADEAAAKERQRLLAEEHQAERQRVEIELKKREAQRKEDEAVRKHHLEMEKIRIEQQKMHMRAEKAQAEDRAQIKAAAIKEEDRIAARDDAIRKISLLKDRCGAVGSGKQIGINTPLPTLLAELELCNTQLNLERASTMPETMIWMSMGAAESAVCMFADVSGVTQDCVNALHASRAAPLGSPENQLDMAFQQCSIMYSHLFSMSPGMFCATTFAKIAQQRYHLNMQAREDAADARPTDTIQEEYKRQFGDL